MVNKRSSKKSMKVPAIIAGVLILIVAIAVVVFMNTGKPGEDNDNKEIDDVKQASIEYKVEYGADLTDETFIVNTADGTEDANVEDLNPTVDSMVIGKTEHTVEVNDNEYDVTVIVADTEKPKFEGVEDSIELENVKADEVEGELSKLITASDPVDGDLEVTFVIEPIEDKENEFNVEASATDVNDNKTTEKFEVVIVNTEDDNADNAGKESKTEGNADSSKSESTGKTESSNNASSNEKSSSSNSSSTGNSSSEKAGSSNKSSNSNATATKPKVESKPKAEAKPTPKPQPKPEAKPTPKPQPKPEPKPEPKPKPKPEPPKNDGQTDEFGNPKLKNPSGLPSGASKYDDNIASHFYNYNRSLSVGSVTTVEVHSESGGIVMVKGNDNDGTAFIALYSTSNGSIRYLLNTSPKLTDSDKNILYEVARSFASAYGM